MNQQEFENQVMPMLLDGDYPVLASLRHQYQNSTIEKRIFSGAGFFTYFKMKEGIPPLEKKNFEIGDVIINIDNIKNAIGVILFIREGYLFFLEAYTLVIDDWPNEYSDVVLKYFGRDGKRDYKDLNKQWT